MRIYLRLFPVMACFFLLVLGVGVGALAQDHHWPERVGLVQWLNTSKGFGFISPCTAASARDEVIVTREGVGISTWEKLRERQCVHFDFNFQDGKRHAVSVKIREDLPGYYCCAPHND
jgi:cold shock CspA family protein